MRDLYRRMLRTPDLGDHQIGEMRQRLIRLAEALCEHVWGKGFY
jgi:hypothetical protein